MRWKKAKPFISEITGLIHAKWHYETGRGDFKLAKFKLMGNLNNNQSMIGHQSIIELTLSGMNFPFFMCFFKEEKP